MNSIRFPTDWIVQARDALARLAENPWALFVVLLAINSIARPYAGITHDARLYSGQVLNYVEGGSYADDLFFRYGSQDEYSLFSKLAAPLVHLLGLPGAFFVIYIVSKSVLIFGMIRLVQTLVPNRTAVALALSYAMIITIHYGGMYVLNVQETFVTPRLLAVGLTLISLDFLLRGRPFASGGVLLAALSIHPLMAFGGLLVWTAYHLWKYAGFTVFAIASVAIGGVAAGVLAYEPLGHRFFGTMDEDWRISIMHASPFNFPSQWSPDDWRYLAFQFALGGIVLWKYRHVDNEKARFMVVLLIVTAAGAIGAVVAEQLPYALLLQGQPYRSLWILAFLHLAFAAWLFVEWAQDESPVLQLAACFLFGYFCWYDGLGVELLFPVCVWPFAVIVLRGLEAQPRDPRWLVHSIFASLVVGGLIWTPYKYVLLSTDFEALGEMHPELSDFVAVYCKNIGPVAILLGLSLLLVRYASSLTRRVAWATVTACLVWQAFCFAAPNTEFYRQHCTRYRGDLIEIHRLMDADHRADGRLPTVYSNLGCLDYIWLDLRSQSYFDWWQAGNFMFRREMAVEGQRRACLVAAFELERFRKFKIEPTEGDKHLIGRFFKVEYDEVHLSHTDLVRLVKEPGLDYVVVEQKFDGLYASQHGRLYLYKCSQVRAALGIPEQSSAVARR